MAKKDMGEKLLADYNDVFADIVNAYFSITSRSIGRKIPEVKPENLRNTRPRSIYKAEGSIHEQERDIVKLWVSEGIVLCLVGLENQTEMDYDMVLRVFGYEGADYRKQLLKRKKERYFVITIVLYYGTDTRWTAPVDLFSRLNVPEGFREHVNNCKVNVLELAWLTDEEASYFKSDFRFVVDYLRQVRANKDYVPEESAVEHIDEMLKLMEIFTGDRRFEDAQKKLEKMREEGEEKIMIRSFLRDAEERGIAIGVEQGLEQGIAMGVEQGIEQGIAQEAARNKAEKERKREELMKFVRSFGMSPEQIKEFTVIYDGKN